jgi:hypothetical protein
MFSVITKIYKKKTKGPTLLESCTATEKLKKFFWQLEIFDVCTTGDTAHIDTIFKYFPHTRQWSVPKGTDHCIDVCHVTRGAPSNISSCQKNFFSFPVAVHDSNKVGRLIFLL